MKTKQLILSTMAVAWGVFGATYSFAGVADDQNYLNTHVRVTDIDLVSPGGVAEAGSQVHFDVTLSDVQALAEPSSTFADWRIKGVTYTPGAPGDHPYLSLNVPLEGESINAATGDKLKTPEARAYFNGVVGEKLRFTYTVRPGDMVTKLLWKKTDDGENNPVFGGRTDAFTVTFNRGIELATSTVKMQPDTLKKHGDIETGLTTLPVRGYTFEVGDRVGDAYDSNYDVLRCGLVPVTIAVPEGGKSPKGKCYVWAMNKEGTKYYPVAISNMSSPDAIVKVSPKTLTGEDTFAAISKNTATLTTPVTATNPLRVMVNVPEGIADSELRICFGRKPADLPSAEPQNYAYFNHALETEDRVRNNFTVQGSELISQTDGTFRLETAIADGLTDAGASAPLNGDTKIAEGGELTVAVGSVASIRITSDYQKYLTDAGTVYAMLEQISEEDLAGVKPASYVIPLTSKGFVLKIAGADAAPADPTKNATEYRIRIPGLTDVQTKDKYYYLRIHSVPKKEIITLSPAADASTELRENFQNVTVVPEELAQPAQKFVMTVEPEPDARRFLIHPITYDEQGKMVRITDEYVFLDPIDGQRRKVLDALARYVSVQQGSPSLSSNPRATLNIRVSAMATTAEFYFVAVNDDALSGIKGRKITKLGNDGQPTGTPVTVSGIEFAAAACNGAGVITGENDDSSPVVLNLQNRAPAMTVGTSPDGSYDQPHFFQVNVSDVTSDYLVVFGRFAGAPDPDSFFIFADKKEMELLYGVDGWKAQLSRIQQSYGVEFGFQTVEAMDDRIVPRNKATDILMKPTFAEGRDPTWQIVAFDSSFNKTEMKDTLKLDKEQKVLVTTVFPGTVDGRGFVLWGDQTPGTDFAALGWTFGSSYTASVIKNAGVVYLNAYPFAANAPAPDPRFAKISRTRDSFFYCWRYDPKYLPALPDAASPAMPYDPALRVNTRFTLEDQKQQNGGKNSDILLSAYFVTEFQEGDAYTSFTKTASTRTHLLDLGDYDADGVPDGWVMANYNDRTMVEGGTLGKTGAPNDVLPFARGEGDAAYRLSADATQHLNYARGSGKGPMSPGAPFTHRMRVRGFEDALNAADGDGNWLSNPAWVVLAREFNKDKKAIIGTLKKNEKTGRIELDPNDGWKQIRLNQSGVKAEGATEITKILYTANRIPYAEIEGVNYVVDAAGNAVKNDDTGFAITIDPNTEILSQTYSKGWIINSGDSGVTEGLTANTGMFGEPTRPGDTGIDLVIGGTSLGVFRSDRHTVAGVLLDEPFVNEKITANSWLRRMPVQGDPADSDGDGMTNGQEYFLWYYASRIAYAYSDRLVVEGVPHDQVVSALWPAIRLHPDGTVKARAELTIGRRYNTEYDAGNPETKNNLWTPIVALDVMNSFNPMSPAQQGADTDHDGLSNLEEFTLGSNPIDCDTDEDGMLDGWEVVFKLNPLDPKDAAANADGDAYASTVGAGLLERPDYHPLFRLKADTVVVAPGSIPMLDVEDGVIVAVPAEDYEVAKHRGVLNGKLAEKYIRHAIPAVKPALDPSVTGVACYLEMPARELRLRDHDVYLALGFNPHTAVSSVHTPAAYTLPFTAVEEFRSAVKVAGAASTFGELVKKSSDPMKADTNEDGVPDGWALYVGIRAYADPTAGPEPGTLDPDHDGLTTAGEYWHRALNGAPVPVVAGVEAFADGWLNKTAPCDPMNPDTDADGVSDAEEGRLFKYVPKARQLASAAGSIGRGMDPNSMDTDGDGLSDGWEAAHGYVARAVQDDTVPAAKPGEEAAAKPDADKPAVSLDAKPKNADYLTAAYTYAVDPTDPNDTDIDPDRDGLTNAQEYYVNYLRHLRYDLSADASRLYENKLGRQDAGGNWVELPDVFNAVEDLAQPQTVPSPLFIAASDEDRQLAMIDPLSVGYAASAGATDEAVRNAFRAMWDRTILYLTPAQLHAYRKVLENAATEPAEMNLALAVEALDAVVARMRVNAVTTAYDSPSFRTVMGLNDDTRLPRELRACMFRVSVCVNELVQNVRVMHPALAAYVSGTPGETPIEKLWAARRNQLYKLLGDTPAECADPAYTSAGALLDLTLTDDLSKYSGVTAPATAYETAVRAANVHPLVRIQYRDALRGLNGGLRFEGDYPYFTRIAWHEAVPEFGGRAFWLGNDIAADDLRMNLMPDLNRLAIAFPSTSPVGVDTDMDGMDDYWEVFHGLNPILGDIYRMGTDAGSSWTEKLLGGTIKVAYSVDRILEATGISPDTRNSFGNESMENGRVSDYNYVAYPWMAGAPFADPDGDGLTNAEEAVNPKGTDVPRYGTDPSPLWMTDATNPNSVVSRFYGSRSLAIPRIDRAFLPGADRNFFLGRGARLVPFIPTDDGAVLPFEMNEGFDTDGDGIDDRTELISDSVLRGEPQSARSPSRQNVAFFNGKGVMQSYAEGNFGATALETFTVECWVRPEANQNGTEVILIDRPWRYSDASENGEAVADFRHNFQIGFRVNAGVFEPFARYTGMGTTVNGSSIDYSPMGAPEVVVKGDDALPAGKWTHIAVTYDGEMLTFYRNGNQSSSIKSGLIPATGVISIKNTGTGFGNENTERYTFRNAPFVIGGTPTKKWFADFSKLDTKNTVTTFGDVYEKTFKGYIDEVRIWNGARTGSEILDAYQRTLTQTELLLFRYNAFMARALGDGAFQTHVPVAPLVIYTFDDMIASSKKNNDRPWEAFPGASRPQTEPGALLARRNGLRKALDGTDLSDQPLIMLGLADRLPKEADVFTSYYEAKVPELTGADPLRSVHYKVAYESPASGPTTYEIVPRTQNTVQHLPEMDIETANFHRNCMKFGDAVPGNWESPYRMSLVDSPSGDFEHLKLTDSVFWTPYAAGYEVSAKPIYDVKLLNNPYGYRYSCVTEITSDYRVKAPYAMHVPTDLLVLGDAYARYVKESWDGSPSTDNSIGGGGSGGGSSAKPRDEDWFEFGSSKNPDGSNSSTNGSAWNQDQNSKGQDWLDENVGMGQTKDDDADRLPNWWESYYTLDPADPEGNNGAHGDPDGDFLTNFGEYLAGANPMKFATAGNGVPDFHIPVWMRRGRPTFGLLYSDNDFMEDVWEAAHRSAVLSPDVNDGWEDADGDGWSNWAEARANFRTARHSTDPSKKHGNSPLGTTTLELPTPAFRMTVDYFGDMNVYTNASANAQIVIHSYTAVNNNSAPDAVFTLPLAYSAAPAAPEGNEGGNADGEEAAKPETSGTIAQDIGMWGNGEFSGFLHVGNVVPGSFSIVYTRKLPSRINKEGQPVGGGEITWRIESDAKQDGDTAKLVYERTRYTSDKNGNYTADGQVREEVGTINYATGFYTLSFPKTDPFWGNAKWYKKDNGKKGGEAADGPADLEDANFVAYDGEDFAGTAFYSFRIMPGTSNTYTVVYPASGWMKEGANNFFVFADLNGDGKWQEKEPAGVPDQQNVDVSFDQINRPLHVTLSTIAPPGAVRVNIIDRITSDGTEGLEGGMGNMGDMGDMGGMGGGMFPGFGGGTVPNIGGGAGGSKPHLRYPNDLGLLAPPEAGQAIPERPIDENGRYDIAIIRRANIGLQGPSPTNPVIEFVREYNFQKPYITEDEIFSALPAGLPGSWDANQLKTEYMVCLLPKGAAINPDTKYQEYAVAVVTNHLTKLEQAVTELVSPLGGKEIGNSEINFDWSCNVQVPTFTLRIEKLEGITGEADGTTVYEKTIRGVTPFATDRGNGQILQYRYRYTLDRGVGEMFGGKLFGNGLYRYTLTLNPYNGSSVPLTGTFRLTMRDSITKPTDPMYDEKESAIGEINSVDSYFVRARVRYNGVLCSDYDFANRQIFIEAHYSASFNGDPVAATSDYLMYNDNPANDAYTRLNPYVVMEKDTKKKVGGEDVFYSTRFDAELRGLATDRPVYLMAYLDLNDNRRRDAWEPWGYATMGKDANSGYYFDPKCVTPTNRKGAAFAAEFYIQDVDTDNDHIADAWEWKANGRPGEAFSKWCEKLTGAYGDQKGKAIWVGAADGSGTFGITAYGAQLLGYTVKQPLTVAPNGAVEVEEPLPTDFDTYTDVSDTIGLDAYNALRDRNLVSYAIAVKSVRFDGADFTIDWDVSAAPPSVRNGTMGMAPAPVDYATVVTEVFAANANANAVYAVYGKAALDDAEWTLLETRPILGTMAPSATVKMAPAAEKLGNRMPAFFRVILTAREPVAATAD